jgi:hypothetical protein
MKIFLVTLSFFCLIHVASAQARFDPGTDGSYSEFRKNKSRQTDQASAGGKTIVIIVTKEVSHQSNSLMNGQFLESGSRDNKILRDSLVEKKNYLRERRWRCGDE